MDIAHGLQCPLFKKEGNFKRLPILICANKHKTLRVIPEKKRNCRFAHTVAIR